MEQWAGLLDQVLSIDGSELLKHVGKISKKLADEFALGSIRNFGWDRTKGLNQISRPSSRPTKNGVEAIKKDRGE